MALTANVSSGIVDDTGWVPLSRVSATNQFSPTVYISSTSKAKAVCVEIYTNGTYDSGINSLGQAAYYGINFLSEQGATVAQTADNWVSGVNSLSGLVQTEYINTTTMPTEIILRASTGGKDNHGKEVSSKYGMMTLLVPEGETIGFRLNISSSDNTNTSTILYVRTFSVYLSDFRGS